MNTDQPITPAEPGDYEFKGIYACAIATGECNDWCQCKVVLSRYGLSVDFIDMPRPVGEQVPVTAFHGHWRKLDQPITPGEGWRLVVYPEMPLDGDEYLDPWLYAWKPWNAQVRSIIRKRFVRLYRRRIEQPAPVAPNLSVSGCCHAPMQVNGSRDGTNFYRCEKCEEPCDPAPVASVLDTDTVADRICQAIRAAVTETPETSTIIEALCEVVRVEMSDTDARVRELESPPPWTKSPPTAQGEYWHWNGDTDCAPYQLCVMYSGTSGNHFVCIKDDDQTRFVDDPVWQGWWLHIPEPKLPLIA